MTSDLTDKDAELLYGLHSVGEALKNPERKHLQLFATKNASQRLTAEIAASGLAPIEVSPRELDRRTGPDAVHQGVLLRSEPLRQPRLDQIRRAGIVLLLDQVTDPHNVGAIMRSAAAFGAVALVTTARHSPEASGVLIKAASGAYEHVPYVKVTNLARAMEELRGYGFRLLGLDSAAPKPLSEADARPPLGIVLGAEGKGLRQLTRASCDELLRLEVPGAITSLNVSNAAAIALYALAPRPAGSEGHG